MSAHDTPNSRDLPCNFFHFPIFLISSLQTSTRWMSIVWQWKILKYMFVVRRVERWCHCWEATKTNSANKTLETSWRLELVLFDVRQVRRGECKHDRILEASTMMRISQFFVAFFACRDPPSLDLKLLFFSYAARSFEFTSFDRDHFPVLCQLNVSEFSLFLAPRLSRQLDFCRCEEHRFQSTSRGDHCRDTINTSAELKTTSNDVICARPVPARENNWRHSICDLCVLSLAVDSIVSLLPTILRSLRRYFCPKMKCELSFEVVAEATMFECCARSQKRENPQLKKFKFNDSTKIVDKKNPIGESASFLMMFFRLVARRFTSH